MTGRAAAIRMQSSYRWVIVAAGGLLGCVAIGAMFSLPVFLLPISRETGWSVVKEGLHRGLAEAPAALMRPILIVAPDPGVEVRLQLGDRAVDALAEGDAVELVRLQQTESMST